MVPVSEWLGEVTRQSFMCKYQVNVIHNGIDINMFKPMRTDLRKHLHIRTDKTIVLGVASPWIPRKGYNDMIKLSQHRDFQIVMVGVSSEQQKELPKNIISVTRTSNQQALAEYYSMADVFVNPTYSDNFPTTNIEALACGTPVITYKTGGSPEAVDSKTGVVVEQGDINAIAESIKAMCKKPLDSNDCRKRAEERFNKDECFGKYIELYNRLI